MDNRGLHRRAERKGESKEMSCIYCIRERFERQESIVDTIVGLMVTETIAEYLEQKKGIPNPFKMVREARKERGKNEQY